MADVSTDGTRTAESCLCIHVGTVHVYLSSRLVDCLTYILDAFLEDSIGRRISDHETGKILLVLFALVFEVLKVNVAVLVGLYHDNLHAAHGCTCRVGSVC